MNNNATGQASPKKDAITILDNILHELNIIRTQANSPEIDGIVAEMTSILDNVNKLQDPADPMATTTLPQAPQASEQSPMGPTQSPPPPPMDMHKMQDDHLTMFKTKLESVVKEVSDKFESKMSDSDKKNKGIIEGIKKEIKDILNG